MTDVGGVSEREDGENGGLRQLLQRGEGRLIWRSPIGGKQCWEAKKDVGQLRWAQSQRPGAERWQVEC